MRRRYAPEGGLSWHPVADGMISFVPGKRWWLRLDGVPPGWMDNTPPQSHSSRGDRLLADRTRVVKGPSGAVYRVHARGRGVLDVILGPLFGPPWMVSWLVHRVVYPDQYTVEIQWYQKPPPDSLAEKVSEPTWVTRSEALDLLDEVAQQLAVSG
jgi:hypothetical protein